MVTHGNTDVFHFGEHFKAVLAAFAAGAGGFHAAKRLAQVADVLGIDEHHAGFNTARQTQHFADVLGPDVGRQAILDVVRQAQSFRFVF